MMLAEHTPPAKSVIPAKAGIQMMLAEHTPPANILLIGYGNPGRQDDGLGPALASAIESLAIPGVTVDANYQLTVEDAAAVAQHDVVIFADADTAGHAPFSFQRVEPVASISFSSHSVEPAAVLGLAHELFSARAEGFLLGIRGYVFNTFGESLSKRAQANLDLACRFIERALRERTFREAAIDRTGSPVAAAAQVNEVLP